jgi:hypothetical protein
MSLAPKITASMPMKPESCFACLAMTSSHPIP